MSAFPKTHEKLSRAEQKHLSTRRLLEAAMEIATESGVTAVTFESIAEKAGYSRGLAFQKFGSKDGLIQAVTDYLFDEVKRTPEMQALSRLNGLEALKTYASLQLRGMRKDMHRTAYFRFFASAVADKATSQKTFINLHAVFREMFGEFLTRGERDGSVAPLDSPLIAAEAFGSFLLGCAMQALADPQMDIHAIEQEVLMVADARFSNRD